MCLCAFPCVCVCVDFAGSAQYGSRRDPSLPAGLDDVLNYELIGNIEQRLEVLVEKVARSSIVGGSETAWFWLF